MDGAKPHSLVTFNYWLDSWIKVTLSEGETKEYHTGGETEEGYSVTDYIFELEGGSVKLLVSNRSQDCDGRMDSYQELICPIDKLAAWEAHDGTMTPDWEKVDSHQRDYTAEAAGY